MLYTDSISPKGYIENFLINILSLLLRFCFFMEKNFSNDRQLGIFLSSIRKGRIIDWWVNRLFCFSRCDVSELWFRSVRFRAKFFERWITLFAEYIRIAIQWEWLRFRWIVIYLSCGLGKKLVRWSGATNQLLPVVVLAMQKDT